MAYRYCNSFYAGFKTKKGYNGESTTKENLLRLIENNVENRELIVEMFDVNENTFLRPFFDFDMKRENYSCLDDEQFEALYKIKLQNALDYIISIFNVNIEDLAISQDNRSEKKSSHIIVPNLYL